MEKIPERKPLARPRLPGWTGFRFRSVRRKGLIYVRPKTPLPPVEQEYYVMQSAFYTKGPYGEAGLLVFSGKQGHRVYQLEGGAVQTIPQASTQTPPAANKEQRVGQGKLVYNSVCFACHQPEGQGILQALPPLAKSDDRNAGLKRAISTGRTGLRDPLCPHLPVAHPGKP